MEIDVVMLAYSKTEALFDMTQRAIDSLHQSETQYKFNVILVETGNLTGRSYTGLTALIEPVEPFNYNRFLNIGFIRCRSNIIVIANNDLIFHPAWFANIDTAMIRNELDSASPYNPGWFQHVHLDSQERRLNLEKRSSFAFVQNNA